jgi:hypothetical protein
MVTFDEFYQRQVLKGEKIVNKQLEIERMRAINQSEFA